MKKLILTLALSQALPAMAAFETINVRNFQGSYNAPNGQARADQFVLPELGFDELEDKEVRMTFAKRGTGFVFNYSGRSVQFANAPEFLLNVNTLQFSGVNLVTNQNQISVNVGSGETVSTDGTASVAGLEANCTENRESLPLFEKTIDACLTNGQAKLTSLVTTKNSEIKKVLESSLVEFAKSKNDEDTAAGFELRNLELNVNSGSYKLKVTLKGSVTATVTVEGKSEYLTGPKEAKIKIEKAKAGIFNITERIFTELSKLNVEGLRVEKPYIYLATNL